MELPVQPALPSQPRMAGSCAARQMRLNAAPGPFAQFEGRHPCYSMTLEGHKRSGRLHLPVSPACNIKCRFCKRDFNAQDQRPGVARGILTPAEAVVTVGKALELCPAINVVGIAGPGDTLATPHALYTFELVHRRYPQLINCLSTNGLLLEEKAEQVVASGVQTVTVTVNAVNPMILTRICSGITYRGRHSTGLEAATQLITSQIAGIRRVTRLGAVVKVNTVLVPGSNEDHIGEIARTVREAGASLINVIPLIPTHELADVPAPDFLQVHEARSAATQYLTVFTHCNRCRADACGIPGEKDYADQLYTRRLVPLTFSHG